MAAQHEEGGLGVGPVGRLLDRLPDGGLQRIDVVGHFAEIAHAPAVGLEALGHVVVVGQLGGAVDGDVVVVVEGEQPPQAEVPGERSRLVRDPLHEAAVAGDDVGAVVAHVAAEGGAQPAFGEGHAHRVAHALAQRPGGDVDPRRVAGLGVPGRPAAPLAELAQVLQREVVPGQVQHGVLEDAGVPVGEHEAIAVRPLRVVRVVVHDARPQDVGQGGQRHGGPRVPRAGLLRRIHGDAADHIDAELHQPGVLHDRCRCLQRHGQTLTVRLRWPRGRHLLFTLMASRMQVPPNSDLTLGMTCVDKATPGRCVWRMRADERFANPAGIMQGGFLGAFADSAMGAAAVTAVLDRRVFCSNAEMKISFLAAVPPGADLTCTAEVVSSGRRVAFVEASVTARADGLEGERLVARASSTYLYKDRG